MTVVIIGHLNRSFTYLLSKTFILTMVIVAINRLEL